LRNPKYWLLGTFAGLALCLAVLIALFDWNWLRAPFVSAGASGSGRSFAIDHIQGEWAWRPHFRIDGVKLGGVDAAAKDLFAAERVEFVVDLPALLRGRLELPEVKLVKPRIALERFAGGKSNWTFGARIAADVALPDKRSDMPLIGRISIEDGQLTYRDPEAGIDVAGEIGAAAGDGGDGVGDVEFHGQGTLQGEKFTLRLKGGSLLALREGTAPYPVTADIALGATRAHVAGTLADPIRFEGLELDVRLRGPNLNMLTKVTGVPLPHTPAYDLTGRLDRQAAVWTFEKMTGRMGHSDLAGRIRIDAGGPRLFVDADLASKILDYRDVGALIGIPQEPELPAGAVRPAAKPTGPLRVLPDAPLMVDEIRRVDARVKFKGDKVAAPNMPLDAVELTLELRDGVLTMKPLALGIAGGRAVATVEIDARQAAVRTDFDAKLSGFRLERFFAAIGFPGAGQGRIDGQVRLVGTGDNVRRALATANGNLGLSMNGGSMSNLALEIAGLDVAQSLGFLLGGDKTTPIRCLVGDVVVANGIMSSRLFLLDTVDTALTVDGEANLDKETLNLRLLAHPKDTSLFSVRAPIRIGGYFAAPAVGIDGAPVGARIAGAIALGVLLTPLAAVLAFIDPSLTTDSDCAKLLAEHPVEK
jgi:uncharacterized protein involved in outer membrane biogenesis